MASKADSSEETAGDFLAVIKSTIADNLIEMPGKFPAAFVEGKVDILKETSEEFPL